MLEEATEQVKQKKMSVKQLEDDGTGNEKVALRAANKTTTRTASASAEAIFLILLCVQTSHHHQ